jgi:hypothetical protein
MHVPQHPRETPQAKCPQKPAQAMQGPAKVLFTALHLHGVYMLGNLVPFADPACGYYGLLACPRLL